MEKYVAYKAVINALLSGRHLSQLDCQEFMVEDMRTIVSHYKHLFKDTHDLKFRWIITPVRKARIKEYYLELKTA